MPHESFDRRTAVVTKTRHPAHQKRIPQFALARTEPRRSAAFDFTRHGFRIDAGNQPGDSLLRWAGPVRYWLSFHIFTGIVGPFMVLTHTAFQFRGLAGITMALTLLVCGSGFLGRYFYTAIPRSLAGVEASSTDLVDEIRRVQAAIAEMTQQRSDAVQALVEADAHRQRRARGDWMLVLLRGWDDWRYRRNLHSQIRRLEKTGQQKLGDVERMLMQRRDLERQMRMLQAARRLLSVWHIAHVPMGVALFSSVAIHVSATLYFGAGVWR